jgi:hypothetical protein
MAGIDPDGAPRTSVTVFVDDAVWGRLPPVCALTGRPSDGTLTVHTDVGRTRSVPGLVTALLFFTGPVGWVVLVLLAWGNGGGGGERLTVRLPWSEAAEHEADALRRRRTTAWVGVAVGVVVIVLLLVVPGAAVGPPRAAAPVVTLVLVAAAVVAVVAAVTAERRIDRRSVSVELDGSRRWVTLGKVHPTFRAAVRARSAPSTPTDAPGP